MTRALLFGTRGSQVQILPLRPAFSTQEWLGGPIWGTKPRSFLKFCARLRNLSSVSRSAGVPGPHLLAYRDYRVGTISRGSRRPLCPGTERSGRFSGFVHDLAVVERSEFVRLAQNSAVHDDGVDIGRLCQRDERLIRIPDRCHVDISSAYENDVSPLAGRE